MGGDVGNGVFTVFYHPYGEDVVKKFGVKIIFPGGGAVNNGSCRGIKTQFYGSFSRFGTVGDEALLHRLVGILLDNAVKYCDEGGRIHITLRRDKRIVLTVENTYADVERIELSRLFDRFYRADRARTFTGGYGVGLSMAKAIVEKHKGKICAYPKDDTHIGFKVTL